MDLKIACEIRKRTFWQVAFIFPFIFHVTYGQIIYTIYEEMKQGSVVGNIAKDLGLDVKELSTRKCHIVSDVSQHYFDVNALNGNLYIKSRIDREKMCGIDNQCLLSLEAVVENPLNIFHITVEVQDINDNPPIFSKNSFNIEISELSSPGARFILGTAQDPDIGNNSLQSYTLSPDPHFLLEEKIRTDGSKYPELVLEKPLDRENQSMYQLTLTAFDGGKPPKSGIASINIIVQDANDNFPVFSQDLYQVILNENVPTGFLVLHLNATDEDKGSNAQISYSFSDVHEDVQRIFTLDSQSGIIRTQGELDFEVTKKYDMTVEAKDGGGFVSYCKVSIQILDANDNAPEIIFTSVSNPISENSLPGTVVALISVRDRDSGENGNVKCQITDSTNFKLISSSVSYYKLITSSMLDREQKSEYNIMLSAIDNGSPPLSINKTIQINISDVNDNPPVFQISTYVVYITENNTPGSSIYKVNAIDQDLNENAQILYSLLNDQVESMPVSSYISINSESGILYAQRSFDYEQLREFQFQVMARDRGSPPLSTNVTVRIHITDKNDNAPKILYPSSDTEGTMPLELIPRSSEKGSLVTKVIAVDADSGHNAWLTYHLLELSDPSFFTIGPHSGEIRIARDLQDTQKQKIVVLVKDNGVPSMSATVTLILVVAENYQDVVPEINKQPSTPQNDLNVTFYLVIAIALVSFFFILTAVVIVVFKCRNSNSPTASGTLKAACYSQLSLKYPYLFSDQSLPLPYSYDVCVTLDSRQNDFANLTPSHHVPVDNLIATDDTAVGKDSLGHDILDESFPQQAQPNTEWRFSQAQRPGPSGAQPTEEAGVWPNNQFETERLQAMILASANEAAEGTSGLGGGTGTMGLSARYGPQFTLQHVPDYRQNVYIPGSTLTPTNAAGKRDGKSGGNKKKSGKKEKK
ncbi:protocadherin gamma-B7-like isoform X29 [Spea bombifrons]|uniref:protocadherin gamma-B7-like isoform X29 n=1 Tax=Spea bombifrons TaxID=233779 RepID=UPI002349C8CF|nr:protocadherin gamma-B7-like isoform X29 [Spea bombifrons]